MDNKLYSKVFGYMFMGLFISFLTGFILSLNPVVVYNVMLTSWFYLVIIIELAIAIYFSARITKMSKLTALICFIIYSITTGFTFSVIFLAYEMTSILYIFLITSILFGLFALYGYYTKKELMKWQNFLLISLLGILLAIIINIFVKNTTFDLIICIIGIIIFLLYVSYDMKKVSYLIDQLGEENGAIYGAFELYLDFVNLFLRLIRLFGKSDD